MERVELAYARHVLHRPGGGFAATDWRGRFVALSRDEVMAALAGGPAPGHAGPLRVAPGTVFSLVSHHGLHRGRAIAGLRGQGAVFVPAVHDLIPLERPDTTRWLQRRMAIARMNNVARLADGVLLFSQAVRTSLAGWLGGQGVAMAPCLVAPLGLDLPPAPPSSQPPYFLCIATIEKRKNHAMLLDAWRRLGQAAPRLLLVGRRSFGADDALRLLPTLPMVEERGHCTDRELAGLLAGARALLLPSQAEGFGIPVAEALAAGTPVIASDIPALREVGRGVPDHLPADDPAAWASVVADYARPDSQARTAQMARMAGWRPATWAAHFDAVEAFLDTLAPRPIRPANGLPWQRPPPSGPTAHRSFPPR